MNDDDEKKQSSNVYQSGNKKDNSNDDANQKVAHVAGKAAGEYYFPGFGSKLYDAYSKTPMGKISEKQAGKAIGQDRTIGHISKGVNNLGNRLVGQSNSANNNQDASSDGAFKEQSGNTSESGGVASNKTNHLDNVSNLLGGDAKGKSANLSGDVVGNEEDEFSRSAFSMILDFVKKHRFSLSIAGPSMFTFLILFLIVLVVCGGILSVGFLAEDLHKNVSGFFEKVENFVTLNGFVSDQDKALNAKKSFYKKLESIRSSMSSSYGVQIDVTLIEATLFYNQGMDAELDFTDSVDSDQEGDFNATTKFYKEAKKKIKQLAKMQIIKVITENECSDPVKESIMDSRTNEEIARDYQSQFIQLSMATKRNKVYHAYEEVEKEDGTTETVCQNSGTSESYGLSVNREGVYYYNLINARGNGKSFVEQYYAEELAGDYTYEDLKEVVDDIYDLYEYIRSSSGTSSFASTSAACPNGVTVISGTGKYAIDPVLYPIGTFDFEEYIAMVTQGENGSGPYEAVKAQAIATRTYTLVRTNNCTKPIRNSEQDQVARANPSDIVKQAVEETAGMVLTYNGNTFASEYSSFKGKCSGDTCSGVYKKLPNGEVHTVTMPRSSLTSNSGHDRGMSQCAANYLAKQGQTYEQILKYFYSDGVEISKISGGSSALAVANGTWQEKAAFIFPSGVPTVESQMSQYLVTFPVETVDINGNQVIRNITAHKMLQADLENIFKEIAASGFPIRDLSCYNWRGMAGNKSVLSHHSYGVACDINAQDNPYSGWGSLAAWKPGVNPYSITPDGTVVTTFNNYGWIWGGHWKYSKDYMHFSFSGH